MKVVLDVELYRKGIISMHTPLEIEMIDSNLQSAVVVLDCARKLYFDGNGFLCDNKGNRSSSPYYLLVNL